MKKMPRYYSRNSPRQKLLAGDEKQFIRLRTTRNGKAADVILVLNTDHRLPKVAGVFDLTRHEKPKVAGQRILKFVESMFHEGAGPYLPDGSTAEVLDHRTAEFALLPRKQITY